MAEVPGKEREDGKASSVRPELQDSWSAHGSSSKCRAKGPARSRGDLGVGGRGWGNNPCFET